MQAQTSSYKLCEWGTYLTKTEIYLTEDHEHNEYDHCIKWAEFYGLTYESGFCRREKDRTIILIS